MTQIDNFSGDYRFLSNFWPVTVYHGGLEYPSVEHAYQAAKTVTPAEILEIQKAETAGKAKQLGKTVTLRPDWDDVKCSIMHGFLMQKFQNPDLAEKLISTYPKRLIEGNTWGDTFWGVDRKKGGKNTLGIMLMNIRETLIEPTGFPYQ